MRLAHMHRNQRREMIARGRACNGMRPGDLRKALRMRARGVHHKRPAAWPAARRRPDGSICVTVVLDGIRRRAIG